MLNFEGKKIYLACGRTDMRLSINGLSAMVVGDFELDIFSASIFVFCNARHNRLKILEWDGDGFWLYLKRLEGGTFKWPTAEEPTMSLSLEEFTVLIKGPGIVRKLKRTELKTGLVLI